jgi:hypothetical protein
MVVLATIDDPVVIARILTHLGLSTEQGTSERTTRAARSILTAFI